MSQKNPKKFSIITSFFLMPPKFILVSMRKKIGINNFCLTFPRHNEFPRELADKRQHEELYRILSDVNAVDHYSQPLPETHDLEHGACLRYTEHHTVNIDIDVSNEHTKQPLEADVLLFAEPLHADTINQRLDS